nr:hypothetical protein [Campylobacter sp.]
MDRLTKEERMELHNAFVYLCNERMSKFDKFYKKIFKDYPKILKKIVLSKKIKPAI